MVCVMIQFWQTIAMYRYGMRWIFDPTQEIIFLYDQMNSFKEVIYIGWNKNNLGIWRYSLHTSNLISNLIPDAVRTRGLYHESKDMFWE